MTPQADWNSLDHQKRLMVLRDTSIDQIVKDYKSDDPDEAAFRARLMREHTLWKPRQSDGIAKEVGSPPNKEVVLGAWRDLDRSEAILELVDNSIDAWNRRREKYPDKSAPELNIYIDIDADTGQLTYEDNAGGVSTDNLVNLVIPGHSETNALVHSIGSYKTGGKKAIFRLATAVNITTRFWNPAETGDTPVAVHLDERWLNDVDLYEFPYYELKRHVDLQRGQTRYIMQLRKEPFGAPWYRNTDDTGRMQAEIRKTYSLLMARNVAINIFFPKPGLKIKPALGEFYDFSGANKASLDIRPQRVEFKTKLDYNGVKSPLTIEVMIGCRATSARGDLGPGFDLYGNNRLFVFRDGRLFSDLLPKGGAANLILGWVNIIGPNVFVPWDTHKRHLNYDRDVIDLIRSHPAIKNLIEAWSEAYRHISGVKVTKTIGVPYELKVDKSGSLALAHADTVEIDATKKRGQRLPDSVFRPVFPEKVKRDSGMKLNIPLTNGDARELAAFFKIAGPLDATETKRALNEKAKEHLLRLIRRRARKS